MPLLLFQFLLRPANVKSNKLRILYIGNKLAVHGRTPGAIDTLGPLLEEEGHTLYYSSSKLKQLSRLTDMLRAVWRYRKTVDVVLIDTYSTAAFYYAWACSVLCKLLGVQYIPILHGGNLPQRMVKSPGMCGQLFGNSYTNVTVSGYMKEHVEKAGYHCTEIGNSIELNKYPFRLRSVLQPKLLWVRAFHETYNPQMAIRLLQLLMQDYPGVHLTMVGPDLDGSMDICKELCTKAGLEKHISFTGKLSKEEWIELSKQCDVFINTTDFDNQPVSVLEAMALGLPVVSTNVGGIPFLIKNNENGLLVDAGDVDAMNISVQKLLTDQGLTERLSTNGRLTAEQFDSVIIKMKWKNLFNTMEHSS